MQRTYFLGGASPQGFETDFWRAQAEQNRYGIYLKGGPGTGKSTLMKRIAAAFAGENISLYHCASDPHSLDAAVLEDRGIFIADATAPHESGTPLPYVSGETVDLAAGLNAEQLHAERAAIRALYSENQTAHSQAKKGLAGIAEMQEIIAGIGAAALLPEKLAKFVRNTAKRLLPHKPAYAGRILYRQSCAVTPLGVLRFLPEQFDLILLHDPYYAAAEAMLGQLAEAAVSAGLDCEITRSLIRKDRPPVQLILPEQKLIFAAVTDCRQPELPVPVSAVHMQRFYDAAKLRQQRSLMRFCAKTAAAAEEQVILLLAEALRVHDALEKYYIRALDTAFLDRTAESLTERIRAFA